MNRILGVDLGTNSIGLTLRENEEFIWYGVYTFRKGVGDGKSGEFSFTAERTKHRSSRRLYNSRRYRKWETLKGLIENDYCPLDPEKLNGWKHYKKGLGRVFPVNDKAFNKWLKLDFDGDGMPDYISPYQLRRELINIPLDLNVKENRYKIGRALYHIAQRRGFKSSRKTGANEKTAVYKGSNETKTIGRNNYEELIIANGTLGAAFAKLEDEGIRIRNRYTLRSDYKAEVQKIIEVQKISSKVLADKLTLETENGSIFYQRPLRSQKGLIGKCTLETSVLKKDDKDIIIGKPRCPISHPKYEAYRAWSYINNIKYRTNSNEHFKPLPLSLKEKIFHEKFFLKSRDFEFAQIRKFIKANGGKDWELNYTHKMDDISVSSCMVSARLKSVFGDDWQHYQKIVTRKNKKGEDVTITYNIDDVWHILFSFEDEEYFQEFLVAVLELDDEKVKELKTLYNAFPVGYANLSLKAINCILPFLQEGLIYSEAVILAKIPEIIGRDLFAKEKTNIMDGIKNVIENNRVEKSKTAIVNNLIFKYYALDNSDKFGWKDTSYQLVESDINDVETAAKEHFGEKTWEEKDATFRKRLAGEVAEKYQAFFASSKREHMKPPHLVNNVKQFIADNFDVDKRKLKNIYHPSQVAIYPKKEGQQYLLSPKTAAFKNPMAYKTLYKLRDVINYLIETGKIDEDTKIVIEIARELNDSNKRWAIEKYQRDREVENRSFAAAIAELLKEPGFKGFADSYSDSDIDKFRTWTEQLEHFEEVKKEISSIENDKKISVTEKDIQKYRLWKEQNCICLYTGNIISITDLFDENTIDFEHTIPRSKSFDNSLANLTVCFANYNRNIKKERLPVNMPNYENDSHGYTAIKPRLENWKKKLESLHLQIETQVKNSKYAMDKATKDDAIRKRHVLQMEYDYWKNKLDRFTRKELPTGFVNSQLVDTQIITKYALHYLKTVFNKVDVIKGSITAEFRKIYGIQPKDEIKDRSQHSHHAIDAAVLTLIPSPRKREEILKDYYECTEKKIKGKYPVKPFSCYNISLIEGIQKNIIINNLAEKDNVLAPAKKLVRKRGKIEWLDKEKQNPKIATGDSVRGELHLQTNYGKIKIAAKDNKGTILKNENGDILYNQIDGQDEMWMVIRKPIDKVNFNSDIIVDTHIAEHLRQQIKSGAKQHELKDFQGRVVRHLRCRVKAARGFMNPENATIVKEQVYKSKKDYKNFIYADSGENYLFGLCENEFGRTIVPLNILESSTYARHLENKNYKELFKPKEPVEIGRGKKKETAELKHVFRVGQKVLFYTESKEELKEIQASDLSKCLYFVKTLADAKQGLIKFQHHLEAREEKQLLIDFPEQNFGKKGTNGFSKFSTDFIAPRLLLSPGNFDFIIEAKDFEMKLDGSIKFKF